MKTLRILVLEEEVLISEDVRICLFDAGHEVEVSFSVSDALDKTSKLNPDLIVIGTITNGGHDEVEAAGLIESSVSYPLKFIFLVSRPILVKDRVKNYQILKKPFSNEELLKMVETV